MIFSGLFKIHFVISYSVFPYEVAIVFHPLGFFLITVIVILDLLYFASFTVSCIFFFFFWLQRTLQTQALPLEKVSP